MSFFIITTSVGRMSTLFIPCLSLHEWGVVHYPFTDSTPRPYLYHDSETWGDIDTFRPPPLYNPFWGTIKKKIKISLNILSN